MSQEARKTFCLLSTGHEAPHLFDKGFISTPESEFAYSRSILQRHRGALSIGSSRGVRGSRPPPALNGQALIPGMTLMKGEDLLRQLEDERRQLRKQDLEVQKPQPDQPSVQDGKPSSTAKLKQQQKQKTEKANSLKKKSEEPEELEVTEENQFELLNKIICPLLDVPYDEQLQMKTEKHLGLIQRLAKFTAYVRKPQTAAIVKSDLLTEYRSKDEFGIQRGLNGNPKTIGFFVGSSKTRLICVEPLHIPIIKDCHVKVASAFQDYIRRSRLPANLDLHDGGFWRGLVVRSDPESRQLMATVLMKTQNLTEAAIENEKAKLGDYFRNGPGRDSNLTSLYFQRFPVDLGAGKKSDFELVFGPPKIEMPLFGHRFHVGPGSYFPGNVLTEEKLLKVVRSHAHLNHIEEKRSTFNTKKRRPEKTVLFDVGCGVGVNSILFSNGFSDIVGFDNDVVDAKYNAEFFGVGDKCNFIPGNYVKTVPRFFRNLENEAGFGLVILNPGRLGVDRLLISQIRDCSNIKKVIYISSNPEGDSFSCFRDLCREVTKDTKKNRFSLVPVSKHFWLQFSVPVDSSPHTAHCQHVFVFVRK